MTGFLAHGPVIRLLQASPTMYLMIDGLHIRWKYLKGGVMIVLYMQDHALRVHEVASMYTVDAECKESVQKFVEYVRNQRSY
jgi:hypothetical protein